MKDRFVTAVVDADHESSSRELAELLQSSIDGSSGASERRAIAGVVIGTLIGFTDDGATPLVTYQGQPGSVALRARATIDLGGAHIGRQTVMVFEEADPCRPIVIGCLRNVAASPLPPRAEQVEVDADGERLIVSARERMVLRCGKASVTLTKEGKVIVRGTYVSHESSGVLRLRGGSVQIN